MHALEESVAHRDDVNSAYIAPQFGPCAGYKGDVTALLYPLIRAIHHEATTLTATDKDHKTLDRLCRRARGMDVTNERMPCDIEEPPKSSTTTHN
ncbi:MAG: hypothetical protein OJJ21_19335 [Ferrovibrio sp.]|uniref:hypothetical protein n=1 Tax=Ferrovibrio sp. TaxID=1917215 RepID=UPI00260F4DE0|nr:hypothetical protein [Ferrovibrio sp.]MCW0235760.1 hypothetical protein [Ferrovibrio sp.]